MLIILNYNSQKVQFKLKVINMKYVTKIEMKEDEHGLVGIGDIMLNYQRNKGIHSCYYYLEKYDMRIELTEEEAEKVFNKSITNESNDLSSIMRFAADSCGIPLFRLKEKSRDEQVVFARYLVIWYAYRHADLSYAESGGIVGKDHATAMHGLRIIDGDVKYLKSYQRNWRHLFMQKLKRNGYIN